MRPFATLRRLTLGPLPRVSVTASIASTFLACSLLVEDPDLTSSPNRAPSTLLDAASPDGPLLDAVNGAAESGSDVTGDAPPGGPSFCPSNSLFCTSFEGAPLLGQAPSAWDTALQTSGTLGLSTSQASHGTQGLRATLSLGDSNGASALQRAFPRAGWGGIRLTFDFHWNGVTYWCNNVGYPQSIGVVRFGPSPSVDTHLFVACSGDVIASLSLPGDVQNPVNGTASKIIAGWNRLEVEFVPMAPGSFKMTLNGVTSHNRAITLAGGTTSPPNANVELTLGLQRFGSAIGIPADVHFDRVVFEPKP